jgi:tRNA modification GTPase
MATARSTPSDTIFAVASPTGGSARGVMRLSGPHAFAAANSLCGAPLAHVRAVVERELPVLGFPVPCLVLTMPGPRSYTGEDVVELHLPGSPLLLAQVAGILRGSLRDALPGEFTRRALENGRLGLAQAEAVLALVHAATEEERRAAAHVLGGGWTAMVEDARGRVQDALAILESGLDFEREETGAVTPEAWLPAVGKAIAVIARLRAGLPPARTGGELLLVGAPSAGKSSLCNALAGRRRVLVDREPGTTRDVLRVEVPDGGALLDAPGDLEGSAAEPAASRAGGALWVIACDAPRVPRIGLAVRAIVWTKVDLAPPPELLGLPPAPRFAVSNVTGQGIEELRGFLRRAGAGGPGGMDRVASRLVEAERVLERARTTAAGQEELAAVELNEALRALDEVFGRSCSEDLLDRIFSRFCIGK